VATTETPQKAEKVDIPREVPIRVTRYIKVDWKMWHVAVLAIAFLIVMFATAVSKIAYVGLAFGLIEAVWYIFCIALKPFDQGRSSLVTKSYRDGLKIYWGWRGKLLTLSDHPTLGEALNTHDPPDGVPPPKPIPLIGTVRFEGYVDKDNASDTEERDAQEAEDESARPIGIARDKKFGLLSGSLWVSSQSLLSADTETKQERREAFASLLDLIAEGGLLARYFAWSDQTFQGEEGQPEQLYDLIRERSHLARANPPNREVFMQRVAQMGAGSWTHETHLHLSIDPAQLKREIKFVGSSAALLVEQLDDLWGHVMGPEGRSPLGVRAASILDINELLMLNRTRLDPVFAQPYNQSWEGLADESLRLSEYFGWPPMADFRPDDHCVIGGTWHMGFYIDQFTRRGMKPEQLWDIIKVKVPKTVTVVFEMPPPHRSQRRAEYSTTGALAAQHTRGRHTATEQVAVKRAAQREHDMASDKGHDGRVRVYIDVTGPSLKQVRANVEEVRKAWMKARFVVEPLPRLQHLGIHATMPLTRGLATMPVPRWW
jgi:hypothetical protein